MSKYSTEDCRQAIVSFFASNGSETKLEDWKRSWKKKDTDGAWLRELIHVEMGAVMIKETGKGLEIISEEALDRAVLPKKVVENQGLTKIEQSQSDKETEKSKLTASIGEKVFTIIKVTSACMEDGESWRDCNGGNPYISIELEDEKDIIEVNAACLKALSEARLSEVVSVELNAGFWETCQYAKNGKDLQIIINSIPNEYQNGKSEIEKEVMDFTCQCRGLIAILSGLGCSKEKRERWQKRFISDVEDFYPGNKDGEDWDEDWSEAPSLKMLFEEELGTNLKKWLPPSVLVVLEGEDLKKEVLDNGQRRIKKI